MQISVNSHFEIPPVPIGALFIFNVLHQIVSIISLIYIEVILMEPTSKVGSKGHVSYKTTLNMVTIVTLQ